MSFTNATWKLCLYARREYYKKRKLRAGNINLIVFSLKWLEHEPTIYPNWGEPTNRVGQIICCYIPTVEQCVRAEWHVFLWAITLRIALRVLFEYKVDIIILSNCSLGVQTLFLTHSSSIWIWEAIQTQNILENTQIQFL
jgi:hypothetical protein